MPQADQAHGYVSHRCIRLQEQPLAVFVLQFFSERASAVYSVLCSAMFGLARTACNANAGISKQAAPVE